MTQTPTDQFQIARYARERSAAQMVGLVEAVLSAGMMPMEHVATAMMLLARYDAAQARMVAAIDAQAAQVAA